MGLKNDEQLIKMSTIIKRALNSSKGDDDGLGGISDEEKEQLMKEIENFAISDKS